MITKSFLLTTLVVLDSVTTVIVNVEQFLKLFC